MRPELLQARIDARFGLEPMRLRALSADYPALSARSETQVTEEVLSAAPHLKVIGCAGENRRRVGQRGHFHSDLRTHRPSSHELLWDEQGNQETFFTAHEESGEKVTPVNALLLAHEETMEDRQRITRAVWLSHECELLFYETVMAAHPTLPPLSKTERGNSG